MNQLLFATFSIVAFDPKSKSWGAAVASKHLAVGAYVPFARAGAGAIASQSYFNPTFGEKGLQLLSKGKSAKEVLDKLLKIDPHPENRQVGIVDAKGYTAAFTGNKCSVWAGELIGNGYTIQGNCLTGEKVLFAMEKAFLSAKGDLAHRLFDSLAAGDNAGGDKRGKQAASLLVSKETTWNDIPSDNFINLRVDDHKEPVKELGRLLALYMLYRGTTSEKDKVPFDTQLITRLQTFLKNEQYYSGEVTGKWDETTSKSFYTFADKENIEHRIDFKKALIDPPVLKYLVEKYLK